MKTWRTIYKTNAYYLSQKRCKIHINNLENSNKNSYLRILKCLEKQSLFCLHCFVNTSDCISSIQNPFQFFVIVYRSLFLLWLSIEVSFSCDWAKEVSWSCPWALRSLLLCVWATCNLILHFSETLLGSARGTWLLPVCGRNLHNCLCSFFLCSLTLYPLH